MEKEIKTGEKNTLYVLLVLELHALLKFLFFITAVSVKVSACHTATTLQVIDVYIFLQIYVFGCQHVFNG